MVQDPFKVVKEIQKGIENLSRKLEKSRNEKLKEIDRRLKQVNQKIEKQFGTSSSAKRRKRAMPRKRSVRKKVR